MRHETKKICKIVDELITLLLKDDTDEVDFKIKKEVDRTIIKIVDYNTKYSEAEALDLNESLTVQRQHEMEEYYWQLVGESDCDSELTLIGAMVDDAIVNLKDGNLYIEIVRKK